MDIYTQGDVTAATGIPRARMKDWISRGLIEPAVKAKGTGTRNLFTMDGLIAAHIVNQLRRKTDIGMQNLKVLAWRIQNQSDEDLEHLWVVEAPGTQSWAVIEDMTEEQLIDVIGKLPQKHADEFGEEHKLHSIGAWVQKCRAQHVSQLKDLGLPAALPN